MKNDLKISCVIKNKNGVITHVGIDGHIITKSEIINNINNGYNYSVKESSVILTKNDIIKSSPDKYLNNNLGHLVICVITKIRLL